MSKICVHSKGKKIWGFFSQALQNVTLYLNIVIIIKYYT
jgi:hypothetical protein